MTVAVMSLIAFAVAMVLTGGVRQYALGAGLLDVPNLRSSHSEATPRGGGLAVVVTVLAGLLWIGLAGILEAAVVWAAAGAGVLVALVGWWDDRGHVAARWRLVSHVVAAAWALYWLGGLVALSVFGSSYDLGWIGHFLAALYLAWLLNLYNFMDGIDGIAGIEAVTVCCAGALLYLLIPGAWGEAAPLLLLAAATAGFLCWNFPRARIFMGDAGSGFIGVMLGVLSLRAGWVAPELIWAWAILLGVFIVDATVTLFRRTWRSERLHEAHRSHAYQYAARRMGSHVPVSLMVGVINLLWLLPIAMLVAAGLIDGMLGVVVAYLPLIGLAYYFKAGARELQEV